MLTLPFVILFAAAALCLGLSRRVATRQLGWLAVGAGVVASGAMVFLARNRPLPIDDPLFRWEIPDTFVIDVGLHLDRVGLGLGLLVLVGGALALLLVTLALAPGLRGFGALFGCALLVQGAALLALLCNVPLIWPCAWAMIALASFATAWSSGALRDGVDGSLNLLYTLPASLLLLVGLILSGDATNGTIQGAGAAICVVVATALAVGLPPFRGSLDNLLAGPAALGGFLVGLGLPFVALATLWRLVETSPDLQANVLWRFGLAAYGILSLGVGAAKALRERNLKTILGSVLTAQAGIFLVGLALGRLDDSSSGPTLLLSNLALTTLAGAATVAGLERHGRGDDYARVAEHERATLQASTARWLALAWGLASASALGIPPLWGFWGYRVLFETALDSMPWIVPPLLAGMTLLAFALLLPLGGFLSAALRDRAQPEAPQLREPTAWSLVPAGYLLLIGGLPILGWPLASTPDRFTQNLVWGAFVLGVGALVLIWRSRRPTAPIDAEVSPAILPADALGKSLAPLAWSGRPSGLIDLAWQLLLGLGEVIQFVMNLFERRYYLAGVLLALLSVLLIMAQR